MWHLKFRVWGQKGCNLEVYRGVGLGHRWFSDWDVQTHCSHVCLYLTIKAFLEVQSSMARDHPMFCKLEILWWSGFFLGKKWHLSSLKCFTEVCQFWGASDKTHTGITGNEPGLLPLKSVRCSRVGACGVPSSGADCCSLGARGVKVTPTSGLLWSFQELEVSLQRICFRTSLSWFQHRVAHALQLEDLTEVPDVCSARGGWDCTN